MVYSNEHFWPPLKLKLEYQNNITSNVLLLYWNMLVLLINSDEKVDWNRVSNSIATFCIVTCTQFLKSLKKVVFSNPKADVKYHWTSIY